MDEDQIGGGMASQKLEKKLQVIETDLNAKIERLQY